MDVVVLLNFSFMDMVNESTMCIISLNCFRDSEFPRISRILPSIHKGFLQNSQANDETIGEEQDLQMDKGVSS
jgi:hypothetical protein